MYVGLEIIATQSNHNRYPAAGDLEPMLRYIFFMLDHKQRRNEEKTREKQVQSKKYST